MPKQKFEDNPKIEEILTSTCEGCGVDVDFVRTIIPEDHAFCDDCKELLNARRKQEEEFNDNLFDMETDEESEDDE